MSARRRQVPWFWTGGRAEMECAVSFTPGGSLVGLSPVEGEDIVALCGVQGVRHSMIGTLWHPERVEFLAEEVEASGSCAGLQVRVRHTFDHTWQFRVSVTNTGDRPVSQVQLVLSMAPGPDAVMTVHAGGVLGWVNFHRFSTGAALGLRLVRGDLVDDNDELTTPPLNLEPGASYAIAFQGEWYDDPDHILACYPPWFPESLDLGDDDLEVEIGHPDAAVSEEAGVTLVSDSAGVTRLRLSWADMGDTLLGEVDTIAQNGVIRSAAEAVLVQKAVAEHVMPTDMAEGFLEAYDDRTPDAPNPLQAIAWARRAAATGSGGLLSRAREVLDTMPPGPGVVLAWLNLWGVERLLADEESTSHLDLTAFLTHVRDPACDPVTAAEFGLLVRAKSLPDRTRLERAAKVVTLLCDGGPARVWPQPPSVDLARAAVIQEMRGGDSHRLRRRLRAAADDHADALAHVEVLAWLALAE